MDLAFFELSPASWLIGAEICLGALIVGRPFRLGPERRDILLLSSDMLGDSCCALYHSFAKVNQGYFDTTNPPYRFEVHVRVLALSKGCDTGCRHSRSRTS